MTGTMTINQEAYIRSLIEERLTSEERERALELLPTIDKATASRWIDKLKSKPKLQAARGNGWDVEYSEKDGHGYLKNGDAIVPRGSYAIPTPHRLNEISFFRIWIGDKDSEWEGAWKVEQRLSDEHHKLHRNDARGVLDAIAKDPAHAAEQFGLQIGQCGICGRGLTNDKSRERGIGPICAARWGW
jgi:Family of unknown function (DUF6011)